MYLDSKNIIKPSNDSMLRKLLIPNLYAICAFEIHCQCLVQSFMTISLSVTLCYFFAGMQFGSLNTHDTQLFYERKLWDSMSLASLSSVHRLSAAVVLF